jgi:hypothetical protein
VNRYRGDKRFIMTAALAAQAPRKFDRCLYGHGLS